MIDLATHWFYAERSLSPGAIVENLRHDMWANGYYNIWLTLAKNEAPYILHGLYGQDKFEVEFEPRQFLMLRTAKENEWLIKAFTRALGMPPHFQYQDKQGQFVTEWRMVNREARWSSMQGVPTFKNVTRLYEVEE